jgi:hypothetical protein
LGKSWPALEIHVPGCDPQLVELVIAEFDDFQPTAIHESDEAGPLRAFFTTPAARDAAAQALAVAFGSYVYVKRIDVEDEDWAARSQGAGEGDRRRPGCDRATWDGVDPSRRA